MLNKDEIKGKAKQLKGTIKTKVGQLIDNEKLQQEGLIDSSEGKLQENVGTAYRKTDEAVEKLKNYVKGK